jgi:prepilin-type N-terminal cleavage/methylation domain-containing protein
MRSKKGFTLIELPVVIRRGFTLIELLIVIAIIGILATIIIINVAGAREKAIKAKVESEMKNVVSIANICKSLAGIGAVNRTDDYSMNQNPGRDQLLINGNLSVCDTSGMDASDRELSSGNYPILPNNYGYNPPDVSLADDDPEGNGSFVSVRERLGDPGTDSSLLCYFSGCVKNGTW